MARTRNWAVRPMTNIGGLSALAGLGLSGTALGRIVERAVGGGLARRAGAGLSADVSLFEFKRLTDNTVHPFVYIGGGIGLGLGLSLPSVDWLDISPSVQADFDFDDLNHSMGRGTSLGAGFVAGGSFAYISSYTLSLGTLFASVDMSGYGLVSMVGAQGQTTIGVWQLLGAGS